MSFDDEYNASFVNLTFRGRLPDHNTSQAIHFRPHGFRLSNEERMLVAAITFVRKIVPPSLVAFGIIGNILALVILHRNPVLRQSSVWYYLKAFLFTSTLVLIFGGGLDWICFISKLTELWNITDGLCRVWEFLSNLLFYSPIWFCVAMTIDRYIYICHPRTAETICNVFAAKITLIFIMIGLIIVSIHALWTYELDPRNGCTIPIWRNDFHSVVWPWVSGIIYSFLPLSFLLIFDTVVCVCLCIKHTRRKAAACPAPVTQDNGKSTLVALVISSTYFLLTMPATIINVYRMQAPTAWFTTREDYLRLELLTTIFQQFAILNHAFMIIICFCCSNVFRKEASKLFLKRVQHVSIEMDLEEYNAKCQPSNGSVVHTCVNTRASLL